jgi:tripartite-type tricarboxylate transporter receptor subunit TctC
MTNDATKDVIVTRRALLHSAAWTAVAVLDAAATVPGRAEPAYPSRPITWVIAYAAGGATDHMSRLVCERLTTRLGQPFTLEYRPGGGSKAATSSVIAAAPDGYTILATSTANVINATFDQSSSFDLAKDLIPVAGLARMPMVLLVNDKLPVRNLAEFLAYARANPRKLTVGTAGEGTVQHLSAELFRTMAGIEWTLVHYRGSGPGLMDLASGHVHAMFDNIASSHELLQGKRIRALAVSTQKRSNALPDLPPIAEVLPGYETSGFYGVAVRAGTPQPIVDILNREINAAIADPAISQRFADMGGIPLTGDAREYRALFSAEIERWRKIVTISGARKSE